MFGIGILHNGQEENLNLQNAEDADTVLTDEHGHARIMYGGRSDFNLVKVKVGLIGFKAIQHPKKQLNYNGGGGGGGSGNIDVDDDYGDDDGGGCSGGGCDGGGGGGSGSGGDNDDGDDDICYDNDNGGDNDDKW